MSWFKKRDKIENSKTFQTPWIPPDSRIELFLDSGWLSYMATSGQIVTDDFGWATEILTGIRIQPEHGSVIEVKDLQLLQKASKKYFEMKEKSDNEII